MLNIDLKRWGEWPKAKDGSLAEPFFLHYMCNEFPGSHNEVIDIGANIGIYSWLLAQKCRQVHAVEPSTDNFNEIVRMVRGLKMPNVTVHHMAISNVDGETTIQIGANLSTATINPKMKTVTLWDGTHEYNRGTAITGGVTLETFCRGKKIDFIKCDIEGGEDLIFDEHCAGGPLSSMNPVIALETHPNVDLEKLYANFVKYGYNSFRTETGLVNHLEPDQFYIISKVRGG